MSDKQLTDWDEIVADVAQRKAADNESFENMKRMARMTGRAMEGWKSVKDDTQWLKLCDETHGSYFSGRFLIDRIGAERHLDPELMAVIWNLRHAIVEHFSPTSPQEVMLVDMAMLSYYHALRINGWIGNFALLIEHEFFGQPSPSLSYRFKREWEAEKFDVEDYLQRVGEDLIPLLDRANRMLIRNLKAIHELRRGSSQSVAIGLASQVNVGSQQVNVKTDSKLNEE